MIAIEKWTKCINTVYCDPGVKYTCSKILEKLIFLKLADTVTFPTNILSMMKKWKRVSHLQAI